MGILSFKQNVPIADLTTYKTQGNVGCVAYPENIEECKNMVDFCNFYSIDYFIIGKGSNLLISPETRKICINLSKMKEKIKIKGSFVYVSVNLSLSKLFLECKKHGLGGIEKVCTIPASVGGTIKNNASFLGEDLLSKVEWITMLVDGKIKKIPKEKIQYSFRHADLPKGIILSAKLKLQKSSKEEINKNYIQALSHRNNIQPKGFSCGCVFKNPKGLSAGMLIEACGLKGKTKGDAIISTKHANFIINQGNATFDDVKYLIEYTKEEVKRKFNVLLEEEVEIIQ